MAMASIAFFEIAAASAAVSWFAFWALGSDVPVSAKALLATVLAVVRLVAYGSMAYSEGRRRNED